MNAQFDIDGARDLLQIISEEPTNGVGLSSLMQSTAWSDGVRVTRVEHPTTWRLLQGQEELVFTIRGVLIFKDLPPMLQRPRVSAMRFKYLRQGVTISGLGTAHFDSALAAASEIFGTFDRTFPDGQMESWSSSNIAVPGDFPALDTSNRYMVPRRDVPTTQHVPFGESVDPRGVLEDMALESEHVHTEENEVIYFASRMVDGERKFEHAQPQIFRRGDIVELQLSFVVVPLKGDQFKMTTVLHSIALLDARFGQSVLKNARVSKPFHAAAQEAVISVKRRIGYGTVEVEPDADAVRGEEKRGRMEVDDATNNLVTGFSTQLNF